MKIIIKRKFYLSSNQTTQTTHSLDLERSVWFGMEDDKLMIWNNGWQIDECEQSTNREYRSRRSDLERWMWADLERMDDLKQTRDLERTDDLEQTNGCRWQTGGFLRADLEWTNSWTRAAGLLRADKWMDGWRWRTKAVGRELTNDSLAANGEGKGKEFFGRENLFEKREKILRNKGF